MACIFPDEASLLRLIGARPMEFSEAWEAGKIYLNMRPEDPSTTG